MRNISLPRTRKMTLREYKRKLYEELKEFMDELEKEDDLEALAGEYMDVVQSGCNYLEALEIDIKTTNEKHIKKLNDRGIVLNVKP